MNIEKGEGLTNVLFHEKKDITEDANKIQEKLENFIENNPAEFNESDEDSLMGKYEELEKRGLKGVLHVIHQETPSSELLLRSLPEKWKKKYYHRLHIISDESAAGYSKELTSGIIRPEDDVVGISKDGIISLANKKRLEEALKNRVGVISGGGPGNPKDPFYLPLLKAMEKGLREKTPGAGICLGHQLYGELILNSLRKESEGVVPGYLEGTTSIESVTDEGKKNKVFEKLGDQFTVASFNEYHLVVPVQKRDEFSHGKVLTRNMATDYPTSLSLHGEVEDQVITTQRHPEIGMKGAGEDVILEDKKFNLPSGKEIIIPAGNHTDMLLLAKYFVFNYDKLNKKYGFTEEDIQDLFIKERMATHLGKNFYGPLLGYMADLRLKQ